MNKLSSSCGPRTFDTRNTSRATAHYLNRENLRKPLEMKSNEQTNEKVNFRGFCEPFEFGLFLSRVENLPQIFCGPKIRVRHRGPAAAKFD